MSINNKPYRTCWFRKSNLTIYFTSTINSYNVRDYCGALSVFSRSEASNVNLDFSRVTHAYPNGMLPVIAQVILLRQSGIDINVILPNSNDVRRLFRTVNWAYHLSPLQYEKSESMHDRHLVTRVFEDEHEQKIIVDDFMDVVLRNMVLPRDIIAGLEWSINEITDNVLNHSYSTIGGVVEATTYPKNGQIAFAVADTGIGILKSLKESIPTLRTDIQAMGEAVKSGVTRHPEKGQGNGLAGSLRFTTMTGGSFEVTSGSGRLLTTEEKTTRNNRLPSQAYHGTLVCGQVKINESFKLDRALEFENTNSHSTTDIIEAHYESNESDSFILRMKDETTGYGTRKSGVQIRTKILNLVHAEPTFPIYIDWEGVPVISSSFADEMMGKLFLELGALTFGAKIRNSGMDNLIKNLLEKAITQRLTQASD